MTSPNLLEKREAALPSGRPPAPDISHLVTETEDTPPPLTAAEYPDISHLITEDDTPVDNLPSEKQQRLLTEPLYSSWAAAQPFLAAANVAVYAGVNDDSLAPDMFLSLDVQVSPDWWEKRHRSYLAWEFGKVPDVAIELVSKTPGGEFTTKLERYARMRVGYYVVCDPQGYAKRERLTVFALMGNRYQKMTAAPDLEGEVYLLTPGVPLGLTLWEGEFEAVRDIWLRWTDERGTLIPTGKERAEQAERLLAQERAEKEKLRAKLRELGVDPATI